MHHLLRLCLQNSEKISEVFTILKRILLITLLIEGIGSVFILQTINKDLIPSLASCSSTRFDKRPVRS